MRFEIVGILGDKSNCQTSLLFNYGNLFRNLKKSSRRREKHRPLILTNKYY